MLIVTGIDGQSTPANLTIFTPMLRKVTSVVPCLPGLVWSYVKCKILPIQYFAKIYICTSVNNCNIVKHFPIGMSTLCMVFK